MMVADLRLGVYYQKCHDPDCQNIGYRSPDRPIPEDINPLSSAQFASDDCDDEELCNLAAEFEDRACNHRSSDSSNYEVQEILNTNGEYTARGNRETPQWDFDWDDEWDSESFPDVHVQHASNVNEGTGTQTKSLLKQNERGQEETRQENNEGARESVEPFKNSNREPTLNGPKHTAAATNFCDHVIGNLASPLRGPGGLKPCKSCGLLALEKCCSCDNSELAVASDEDVCDWLEDDSISDLDLSIAAEEVESTAY